METYLNCQQKWCGAIQITKPNHCYIQRTIFIKQPDKTDKNADPICGQSLPCEQLVSIFVYQSRLGQNQSMRSNHLGVLTACTGKVYEHIHNSSLYLAFLLTQHANTTVPANNAITWGSRITKERGLPIHTGHNQSPPYQCTDPPTVHMCP